MTQFLAPAVVPEEEVLEESLRPRRLEMKHVLRGGNQAANALQLDNRFDNADEQQTIAAA